MARPGQREAADQSKTLTGNQQESFGAAQQDIGQFNKNLDTLKRGGDVAANPWMRPDYLANVNRLQSGALNAAGNAGEDQLRAINRRTGGMNNSAVYGAVQGLTGAKMRLGDQLSAERAVADQGKNVAYQTAMAEAPLAGAQAQAPFYGSSVQGNSSAIGDLTQLGIAQYGPWNTAMGSVLGGAGYGSKGWSV